MPKTKKKQSLASRIGTQKIKLILFAVIFALIGVIVIISARAQVVEDGSIPVFRVEHAQTGMRLWTTDEQEAIRAWSKLGFKDEGTRFYAWKDGSGGRIPVFRLGTQQGGYLLTSSQSEKDTVIKTQGMRDEGIAFYGFSTPGPGRAPMFRLYNQAKGHLFTTDATERDNAKKFGFTDEGTVFYVSAKTPPVNNHLPKGALTENNCKTIKGVTVDSDFPGRGNEVHVYIDGQGSVISPASMQKTATQGGDRYVFTFNVPANWRNRQIHKVTVYSINTDSTGRNTGNNKVIGEGSWVCDNTGKDLKPEMDKYFHSILHDCTRPENFVSDRCKKERDALIAKQIIDFSAAYEKHLEEQRIAAQIIAFSSEYDAFLRRRAAEERAGRDLGAITDFYNFITFNNFINALAGAPAGGGAAPEPTGNLTSGLGICGVTGTCGDSYDRYVPPGQTR